LLVCADPALTYVYLLLKSGGSDTVLAALYTFILSMLCHPDKQAKVQAEIDRVVGPDRLPDYDDEPNLPYLSAAIKESFR
jgi:cytochrome P450